jgi:hypothetical protein
MRTLEGNLVIKSSSGTATARRLFGVLLTKRMSASAATVLLFALGQPTPSPTPGPPCGPTWGIVDSPNVGTGDNSLLAVDAISPTDMWAVGTYQDDAGDDRALTLHWDGAAWTVVPAPSVGEDGDRLVAVSASSSTDVWAVGISLYDGGFAGDTLTMHWNGEAWRVVPSPSPDSENDPTPLTGVVALSPSNAWAVGYYHEGGATEQTLILHWDGVAWTIVPSPNVNARANILLGVTAISATDIWAVGFFIDPEDFAAALTMHWDGAGWSVYPTEVINGDEVLLAVDANGPSDVWGVGAFGNPIFGQAFGPLAEHWDGSLWEDTNAPDADGENLLAGVSAISSADVWAVGYQSPELFTTQTLAEHWDGGEWVIASTPNVGTDSNSLAGVTEVSPQELWSVGSYTDEATGASRTLTSNLCPLQVRDDGFSQTALGIARGATVAWSFPRQNRTTHSVTDGTRLSLYDSGLRDPGSSFVYTFIAAGTFQVLDQRTGDRMTVEVPAAARPRRGGEATRFLVQWASDFPPFGYTYDVQIRRPGSSQFEDWKEGTFDLEARFVPDAGPGTYWFRARIRVDGGQRASGWSRPVAIQVD